MSKKHIKHKKKENKATWHKAASRHHIGAVPSTRIHSSGGGPRGAKKKVDLSNITLNNVPLDELVITDEELEVSKKEGVKSSLAYRPYVPTSGTYKQKYSGRSGEAKNPYSEEILAHYQFLVVARGNKEASEYLNSLKGVQVDTATQFQPQLGPIEKALQEAEQKVKFFRQQAVVAQQEEIRWAEVVRSLQEALALSTGKKRPETAAQTEKSNGEGPRVWRDWKALIPSVLAEHPEGLTRSDLRRGIQAKDPTCKDTVAYNGIQSMEQKGVIILIDGKFFDSSATTPEKSA